MTLRVSIVSDSTGETAESMLHAALAQFDGLDVTIERHRSVREVAQVHEIAGDFYQRGGHLIVSTLVKADVSAALVADTKKYNLGYVSMMGPLVEEICRLTGRRSSARRRLPASRQGHRIYAPLRRWTIPRADDRR